MTEILLRIAGGFVAAALGALTALYEVFYTNLSFGTFPAPFALLAAFGANYLLTRFAWFTVGTRWSAVLAIIPWVGVMIAAVSERSEGDWIVLPDSGTGALTIVAGLVGFAVPFFTSVLARPRPIRSDGPVQ